MDLVHGKWFLAEDNPSNCIWYWDRRHASCELVSSGVYFY